MSPRFVSVAYRSATALAAALLAITPLLDTPAAATPAGAAAATQDRNAPSSASDGASADSSSPAQSGKKSSNTKDRHPVASGSPTATDVASTPLRDLNLDGKNIPAVLNAAVANPYAVPRGGGRKAHGRSAGGCGGIASELASLDAALGPDIDVARAANRPYTPAT